MTTNGRAAQRVPSRTHPFVLVGLIVVLSFLSYSYYSLSSSNSNLSSDLEAVRLEKRDVDSKRFDLEKTLSSLKAQASSLQTEAAQLKRDIQVKDMEIQSLKADVMQKVADDEKQKSLLERCDEKLSVVQKDLESANNEKTNLQNTLDAEREKTAVCTMEACQGPIRQILIISSKLVGSTKMQEALSESQLDGNKMMDGINIPAPKVEMPQDKLQPYAASGKEIETKKDDFVHQAADIKESQATADKMKESVSRVISQGVENETPNKKTTAAIVAVTEAPGIEFEEVEHQGGADGKRSFPIDSNGDKEVEEFDDDDDDDKNEDVDVLKVQREEQGGQHGSVDKPHFEPEDRFKQLKPGDVNTFSESRRDDGNAFHQLKSNEGSTFSLGMDNVFGETSKTQEVVKEPGEPKAVSYQTFLDNQQGLGGDRKADSRNGENMAQNFEDMDKKEIRIE